MMIEPLIPRLVDLTPPSTYEQWLAYYKPEIRVRVDWEILDRHKPRVAQSLWCSGDEPELFLPYYKGGNYRSGRSVRFNPGDNPFLVRVPASTYKGRVFVLDGSHRLRHLRPSVVVVDELLLTKQCQMMAFSDHMAECLKE